MGEHPLIGKDELAGLLRVSTRTLNRRRKEGAVPAPLAVSAIGSPLWNRAEIAAWLEAGAPDAATWRAMRSPTPAR